MRHRIAHRGLVLLSGLILCLHTIVPHVHAPQGAVGGVVVFTEQSDEELSLLDTLIELVTADLGEDHLEHFTPADGDLDLTPPVLPPVVALPSYNFALPEQGLSIILSKQIIAYHPLLPDDDVLVKQGPLRGPPVVA